MPMAIPIIMVVGAAVAAYGAYQQGQAQKKAANFNAKVAEQNATISRKDAAMQQQQHDRETYLRMGALKANAAASGGSAGQGSALDVLGDVAGQSALERQMIGYRGEMAARGYGNTASLEKFSGKEAAKAGTISAGATLLQGIGSAAGAMPAGGAGGSLARAG